ncbi:hypothetical protein [Streptomyces sp. NPDC048606]|uniref:hypothetical protein n=1 Tax=Streptomyces sp. NPDC048606 TaxID=3154726 RepID=UPI0034276A6F
MMDPLGELRRVESDPAYRALFLARLEAEVARRRAEREEFTLGAIEAADRMRELCRPRRARGEAVAVPLGAVLWIGCVAFAAARGWGV